MTKLHTLTATPAKLRDDSWGARTPFGTKNGISRDLQATLQVTTKAGKTWSATYICCACGDDWALWSKAPSHSQRRSRYYSESRGGAYDGDYCGPDCAAQYGSTCMICGG